MKPRFLRCCRSVRSSPSRGWHFYKNSAWQKVTSPTIENGALPVLTHSGLI